MAINILPSSPGSGASPSTRPTETKAALLAERNRLTASPDFVKRYRSGSPDARRELHELNARIAGAPVELPEITSANQLARNAGFEVAGPSGATDTQVATAIDGLRKDYDPGAIRSIIGGTPVTFEARRKAEQTRARLLRDRGWLRGYREGDQERVAQMKGIVATLAAPVAG